MSILFVGNDAADFFADYNGTSIYNTTSTEVRDSNFVSRNLAALAGEFINAPFGIQLPSTSDDLWLHFRFRQPNVDQSNNRGAFRFIRFYDSNDKEVCRLEGDDANHWLRVYGDTTVTGSNVEFYTDETVYTVDIHIERDGTTDVTMTLYTNGIQVQTVTAANTTAGNVAIDRIYFENFNMVMRLTGTTDEMPFSEFIVTDGEDTRGWRLAVLTAASDGTHTDFSGGAAEVGDADIASAASASANGDKASFNPSTYSGPTTSSGIRAVVGKALASRGDTGPAHLRQFLRISATDYEGDQHALTVQNDQYVYVWDNNPNTAGAWDSADLSSLEFGVKAET